jgi:flagellar motor switch protein FliM
MGEEMSQDEIDALLSNMASGANTKAATAGPKNELSQSEIDALLSGDSDETTSAPIASSQSAFPSSGQSKGKAEAARAQSMQFSSL